ncbi:hypothetical protein ACIRYZ_42585 [Kitasatospora sp. NPDC101155]|uniref:hypothetical protein n=1 Tax=Kitasatospora sp. NPDC101155 TaxID=3364097 RepID=UPI0038272F0F
MEQQGRAYEQALEIAATDARAAVVEVVAAALENLGGDGQEVRLGPLLWHLDDGLRGRARGDEGVDALVGAVEAVSLALAAERGAWDRDTVVRITGGDYAGRSGLVEFPCWEPDHAGRDIAPGPPNAYQVDLGRSLSVRVPTEELRVATPTTDPEVYMSVSFPGVWFGCVVWGDRLVRWSVERRGEDVPLGELGSAALLVSAALWDVAKADGLGEPADGSALLDTSLTAVGTLLNGTYDETIVGVLERTRPEFSATEQPLDGLRTLWGVHAGVEELHLRRRIQRLAHAIVIDHQAAGMRPDADPDADPADYLTGQTVVRLRDRLDDLAVWEQDRRARAWQAELHAHIYGDE